MASAGNPNQPAPFDVHKLFKPPPNSGSAPGNPGNPPSNPPFPPPISYPAAAPSYPVPPPGPFSYPPQTVPFHQHHPHPFLHYPQDPLANVYQQQARPAIPYGSPVPNPSHPPPNSGARLMALLGTSAPATLETAVSMPPPSSLPSASSGEFAVLPVNSPVLSTVPSAPPMISAGVPQTTQARLPSGKQPHGRHITGGDRSVYDVDVRESPPPPQLEVTPITKYSSDPGLVLGRQIAVNRSYICYGLRQGNIRVLNINTALRSLLRGHSQRVTDMAFFAEDVHLLASASVDGRVFVWKINEGPDKEDKPQITGKIIVAIQIVSDGESFHPQVCWHCHKQEILVVGIGNRLLKIDMTKVGKGEVFSEEEEPLQCHVDKLIDGVQLIGRHDQEVTDLSMCQWMMTRLASASKDGTVKIWDDRKATPLVTLRPHDGQPVNCVSFLTAPHRPDHILLITAGPLNREVKIWASANQEGWLLPSDCESWLCMQTLELRSCTETRVEDAFFNQVVVLPQAHLILLANAKKNVIYAVHIDYGSNPLSTRMDYVAEFSVKMPILSITATSDCYADGKHVIQIYCVQTQAIQQYALDLSQCLPPPLENAGLEKDLSISYISDAATSDSFASATVGINVSEDPSGNSTQNFSIPLNTSETTPAVKYSLASSSPDNSSLLEITALKAENRPSAPPISDMDADISPRIDSERRPSVDNAIDQSVARHSVERGLEVVALNLPDAPLDDSSVKGESKPGPSDITMVPNLPTFPMGTKVTHLVTPSEILSKAVSSTESNVIPELEGTEARIPEVSSTLVTETAEVEVKVVGESGSSVHGEPDSQREPQIHVLEDQSKSLSSQFTESNSEIAREDIFNVDEVVRVEDIAFSEGLEQPYSGKDEVKDTVKDESEKDSQSVAATLVAESVTAATAAQSSSVARRKRQKAKQPQTSGPSSPPQSPFDSTDSFNEQESNFSTIDAGFPQTLSNIQAMLSQVMAIQTDMQNQMNAAVSLPVTKEGKRVEVALGRCIEKAIKANNDVLWARFQEEIAKREKLEKDRMQQVTSLISNSLNKDLPAIIEKIVKKENSSAGPNLARSITPVLEKAISSAIADSFQKGVGDKAVNQLEKSVNSKLEVTVARQIQAQFQTSAKQYLQDGIRTCVEASIIPSFELACKAMFEQIDAGFHKGMLEHTATVQQQLESAHTPLALSLREAVNSALAVTQALSNEIADGQRKLLSLVAAGNPKSLDSMAAQQANGPLGGLHEMAEAAVDPTKELTRLITERKFDEAFTMALQRSDVSIVSWLCSQVDLQGICSMSPLPLSQGVLLSLLQQLACDLAKETTQKLAWMTQVAVAINPSDPMIALHVRPIFDQVYQILAHQRSLPTTTPADANSIRLMLHVINSADPNMFERESTDVEAEPSPSKNSFTTITPSVHAGFSFSIIHLLSSIRKAMVTFNAEDAIHTVSEAKNNGERHGPAVGDSGGCAFRSFEYSDGCSSDGQKKLSSLTVREIANYVRINPGDPCILEMQEPLEDLVRGALKILSSTTAPLGAKGWEALMRYEKSTKSWSWIGPVSSCASDLDAGEEETSSEAWGIPQKMLVKLVDAFANWLKNIQEIMKQIANLPPPPIMMLPYLDEKERFRDLRAQKSLATINPSSDEVRAYFHSEEVLRYSIPDRAFSYTAIDGRKSTVAPLRRGSGKPISKARDHFMLKPDRPPHITVLCLVRDAAARLPGSLGTRLDICTLIRDSQYLVEDVSNAQVNSVVSGALDRLHYEQDPCVQFDVDRKLWVYLHRDREEEDFEDFGTSSTKKSKWARRDDREHAGTRMTADGSFSDIGDLDAAGS